MKRVHGLPAGDAAGMVTGRAGGAMTFGNVAMLMALGVVAAPGPLLSACAPVAGAVGLSPNTANDWLANATGAVLAAPT